MDTAARKEHWENIYQTKSLEEVSWYQKTPITSLELIQKNTHSLNDSIIDIGGGDSFLADHLIDLGYTDITVLDISQNAIERAQKRLGENAAKVKWIVSDVMNFTDSKKYVIWHDRAVFHFLTNENDIQNYAAKTNENLNEGGKLIIGTFSENGPKKCSGIEIKQYSKESLPEVFNANFHLKECFTEDHQTPFNTTQNFVFCSFSKK